MTSAWKQHAERGSPRLLALLIWIALRLGRPVARALLYPITAYFFVAAPRTRRASRAFLGRVLPRPPTALDVFRHIHTFAACLLDRIFLMAGRLDQLDVRVCAGGELLPDGSAGGALLLVSHVGSYEAMRVLGSTRRALSFRILVDRAHARMMQTAMERLNPALAAQVIDAGDRGPLLALAIREALAAGHVVGLMGDRLREGEAAVEVQFLGGRVQLPASPWHLAASLDAPVILCFGLYRGANRYDLYFERLPALAGAGLTRPRRAAAVQAFAQRYADRLAHFARSAPYNWFNFYDLWADAAPAR